MNAPRTSIVYVRPLHTKAGTTFVRKPTHYINRKAGASLLHAPRTAKAIGRPLNVHVTVSLWKIGIAAHEAFDMFAKLRNQRFQRWSTYTPADSDKPRNGPPTHAWVFEAPEERLHLHWMVHIQSGNMAAVRKQCCRNKRAI